MLESQLCFPYVLWYWQTEWMIYLYVTNSNTLTITVSFGGATNGGVLWASIPNLLL